MQEPVIQDAQPIEGKKGLVLKIVIIIFLLFLLSAACGIGFYVSEKKLEEYLTNWVKEDFNTYLKTTSQIPDDFPINEVLFTDDYRVYKAGTNPSGLWKNTVVYVTSKDVNYVKDLYANKMLAKGWTLESTNISNGVDFITLVKDKRVLMIGIEGVSKDGINITAVIVLYMEE